MALHSTSAKEGRTDHDADPVSVPFSSNAVRLGPRSWAVTALISLAVIYGLPAAWKQIEKLDAGPDYRVPYRLSSDYWMVARYYQESSRQQQTLVLGDSVVWGHYVRNDETVVHFLNRLGGADRFANLGIDGIHPAALLGLVRYYGGAITQQDVILHANLLWMSSERHDLQGDKEFSFNHPQLVAQFVPWIPCYKETISRRLGIVISRQIPVFGWTRHLRIAYLDNTDLPRWTMQHPYENPASHITLELPEPSELPSPEPRAQPWTVKGIPPLDADWVELDTSLQWRCFRETVELLERRGNRVFVLVGPFNEYMLTATSRAAYRRRVDDVRDWLRKQQVPHAVATLLPSHCYADASHPLADGYARMAGDLWRREAFRRFLNQAAGEQASVP